MHYQFEEQVFGDCINAIFHGFFLNKILKQQQSLSGNGIVIDDEFNFIFSEWKDNSLNGRTFIRTITSHLIYGFFEKKQPKGILAILLNKYKIYLQASTVKNRYFQWSKDGLIIDQANNLLYVIELNRKQQNESTSISRTERLLSESFRNDPFKIQWKIKILERSQLKVDGSLSGISKLIRKRQSLPISMGKYEEREKNILNIFYSFFGEAFSQPQIISPDLFLKELAQVNKYVLIKEIYQSEDNQQYSLFFSMKHKAKTLKNDKKLGILLNIRKNYIISLGQYDVKMNLSGLGIQYLKNGQSYIGIFKENLIIKQYKYNSNSLNKNLVTFPIRQLLAQQHLKSLNYVHNCVYIPQICNFIDIGNKIITYIQAFQAEFQKRNLHYHDSPHYNSNGSSVMNIYKYTDLNKDSRFQYEPSTKDNRDLIMTKNLSAKHFKKPGFILKKSLSSERKGVSPSKSMKAQKSPLRQIRIKGKIYRNLYEEDDPNKDKSHKYTMKGQSY